MALGACTVSRSVSTGGTTNPEPTPTAVPEQVEAGTVGSRDDPPDPLPGLELYYDGADGTWSYSYTGDDPQRVPAEGLSFAEEHVAGPDDNGWYKTALVIKNDGRASQAFTKWLVYDGAPYESEQLTAKAGESVEFLLTVKKGDSNDGEWHVKAGDDPVIKIRYQFPVKPVGQ